MKSKLFTDIEKIVPTLDGWCDVEKALTLAAIVIGNRPRVTVEVGVFGGRSLIPMAMAVADTSCGLIYAIDPWSRQESVLGQKEEDAKWWRELDHEAIYKSYLSGLERSGAGAVVKTIRSTSIASIHVFSVGSIDLFHLDGNHGEQAFADIKLYYPKLAKKCVVVLDDLAWSGGFVGKAADFLLENGFERKFDLGTGAVFSR